MERIVLTVQSSVFAQLSAFATTIHVAAASGSGAPSNIASTVPVEVPILEETKAIFGKMPSVF